LFSATEECVARNTSTEHWQPAKLNGVDYANDFLEALPDADAGRDDCSGRVYV
jgi:hypothetical protein